MSDYRNPPPDPSPSERRFRRVWFTVGLVLVGVCVLSLAGFLMWAFRAPGPEERAKIEPPRQPRRTQRPRRDVQPKPTPPPVDPGPAVPPPRQFEPREVPMGAQGVAGREERPVVPSFTVGDEHGSFTEPETPVLASIDGQTHITLRHLWLPDREITVPVTELKIVSPYAKRTKRGNCCGAFALKTGRKQPRNTQFYKNSRVACAAYTAYILRHCGRPNGSFSATAQYGQLRRWSGRLVATRMSTRYIPYLRYLQSGDFIFFHKGSRFGHLEIYVGNGMVSGTSSSQGKVAIRRLANRGFSQCTVVRL